MIFNIIFILFYKYEYFFQSDLTKLITLCSFYRESCANLIECMFGSIMISHLDLSKIYTLKFQQNHRITIILTNILSILFNILHLLNTMSCPSGLRFNNFSTKFYFIYNLFKSVELRTQQRG